MLGYILLALAIVIEVVGTISLRMVVHSSRWWGIVVVAAYAAAFALLAAAMNEGIPLGVAYGIWTAAGVALTAVLSRILFKEPLTWVMGIGICLIAGGVLLLELGMQ